MATTEGFQDAPCALCERYGLQVISARDEAALLVGRANRVEARSTGRRSARVDALRAEASRLKESARVSERWLADHRAEAHGAPASAAA